MTAQAEPIGTPEEGPGRGRFKINQHVAGIAAAVITGMATIVAASGIHLFPESPPPVSGSIEEAMPNANDTAITVAGTATPDVGSVLVTVGPRNSDGGLWADMTNVYGQRWSLNIPTEPALVPGWVVKAWYKERAVELTSNSQELPASLEDPPPTPAPAPPGQILECVVVHGDSCLQGQPGWGSPSIYQSQQ